MFPGMVEVKTGVIASRVVADPLSVVIDVRRVRMVGLVAERPGLDWPRRFGRTRRLRWLRHGSFHARWAMFRDVSAPDGMAAAPWLPDVERLH